MYRPVDLGGCYPTRPEAKVDNSLQDVNRCFFFYSQIHESLLIFSNHRLQKKKTVQNKVMLIRWFIPLTGSLQFMFV